MKPYLAVLLLWACADTDVAPFVPVEYDPHPEPPTLLRDVALIDDEARFTRPYVPAHRTTMDGRVGLRVQGGAPGPQALRENLSFYLFTPEAVPDPLIEGPPGPNILADPTPFDVPFPRLDEATFRLGHHALCDPTLPNAQPGERPNPYVCGPEGMDDCYDFTVISSTSKGPAGVRLWGTPVLVQVQDPKTPQAKIVDVQLGEPVAGAFIGQMVELMEPAVTEDGRLLTGRLGRFPREWTNPETGETLVRPYDLVYFQLPEDAEPCDVTGWTDFHPLSHAPYDPRMIGEYGLAAYPFRDTEGALIPDGEDLGGTYPWVDREGNNVFMTGIHGRIVEQSEDRFPRRCVHEGCEQFEEPMDWDRGFMVGGLWTHGKFALLDGMINHLDWAVGVTPKAHWMVDLYQTADGEPVSVRLGAGRFSTAVRDAGGPYPEGYTHNANILDSPEHLFNHQPHLEPVTPRDVVWVMSSGVATEEIDFDDLLDPDALIVSNMGASITQNYDELGRSQSLPHYWNGQVRRLRGQLLLPDYALYPDQDDEIHLQNGATSLRWNTPPFGWIAPGTARIEPAALGGIYGRGLWLSGEAEIRYDLPDQPRALTDQDLYVGIFIDPRLQAGDEVSRGLLRFPDQSEIRLAGRQELQYLHLGRVLHRVQLPPSTGWTHLGLQVQRDPQQITLLVDGLPLDRFQTAQRLFLPTQGALYVGPQGAHGQRFRGWIDEFKVLLHQVDPEVACNHARGTLVRIDDHPAWQVVADRSPAWAHEAIAQAAGQPQGTSFACFHDYQVDHGAHLGNIPQGTTSMREAIHFPEGPLRAGAPRPDSSQNAFCLSCHTAEGRGGMSLDALAYRPDLTAEHDPRRQPDQPPRRVFGHIPAGWIPPGTGPGSPAQPHAAPEDGALIDLWLLPGTEQ